MFVYAFLDEFGLHPTNPIKAIENTRISKEMHTEMSRESCKKTRASNETPQGIEQKHPRASHRNSDGVE